VCVDDALGDGRRRLDLFLGADGDDDHARVGAGRPRFVVAGEQSPGGSARGTPVGREDAPDDALDAARVHRL
jgi:hypothetical protein